MKNIKSAGDYWGGLKLGHKDWEEWREMTDIAKIRIRFVHQLGVLGTDNRSNHIREYVNTRNNAGHSDIVVDGKYMVIFSGYCEHAMETYRSFIQKQIQEVPMTLQEASLNIGKEQFDVRSAST